MKYALNVVFLLIILVLIYSCKSDGKKETSLDIFLKNNPIDKEYAKGFILSDINYDGYGKLLSDRLNSECRDLSEANKNRREWMYYSSDNSKRSPYDGLISMHKKNANAIIDEFMVVNKQWKSDTIGYYYVASKKIKSNNGIQSSVLYLMQFYHKKDSLHIDSIITSQHKLNEIPDYIDNETGDTSGGRGADEIIKNCLEFYNITDL